MGRRIATWSLGAVTALLVLAPPAFAHHGQEGAPEAAATAHDRGRSDGTPLAFRLAQRKSAEALRVPAPPVAAPAAPTPFLFLAIGSAVPIGVLATLARARRARAQI